MPVPMVSARFCASAETIKKDNFWNFQILFNGIINVTILILSVVHMYGTFIVTKKGAGTSLLGYEYR